MSKKNKRYISETEMDKYRFSRQMLEAQLLVAQASVQQAEGNMGTSKMYLEYTKIISPVDGVVIDRKIDAGQTLAAQFQTPEMFVVAPGMEKRMYVYASVDEADIGLIRDAQKNEHEVTFTVDAYPDDLFTGKIFQVRVNPTTTQNVVTYTVVVVAPNPERKLLPGMTANLSFQIEKRTKDHQGSQRGAAVLPQAGVRSPGRPEGARRDRNGAGRRRSDAGAIDPVGPGTQRVTPQTQSAACMGRGEPVAAGRGNCHRH